MRRISSLLVLGLVMSTLTRCDCQENIQAQPVPEVEVKDPVSGKTNDDPEKPEDGNEPLVISFGVAEVGTSAERTVEIFNRGDFELDVTRISFANADATDTICPVPSAAIKFKAAAEQAPRKIQPGEKSTLTLLFDPSGGSHCRTLLIQSDDADEATVKVYFTASGEGPRLCADPDTGGVIDFGASRPGVAKNKSQTIRSCGSKAVRVSTISLGEQLNDVFSILAPLTPPAAELPPCDGSNDAACSFTVDLEFLPDAGGSFTGVLNIVTTSAAGDTPYPFQLVGRGAECNLVVTPTTVNFGSVAANGMSTQLVLLRNSGVCHCQVDAITPITPSDVGFSFQNPLTVPLVLRGSEGCDGDPMPASGASSTASIQVIYQPGNRPSASTDNATFHVQSASSTATPDVTINLEATGGGTPRCELTVDPELPVTASGGGFNLLPEDQTTYQRLGLLRFGNVTANITKKAAITFTNIGNTNCEITNLAWDTNVTPSHGFGLQDATGALVFVGGNPSLVVQPGDQLALFATFTPATAGEKWVGARSIPFGQGLFVCGPGAGGILPRPCGGNGLTITTTAQNIDTSSIGGGAGIVSIGFNAASVAPAIDVIPGELDYGLITLGCGSEEKEVKVYNTGAVPLSIVGTSISPVASPEEFRITASPAPVVVAPGGMTRIKVRFYPRRVGIYTANLVISTDEGNMNYGEYTVPLQGEGTTESHVVDVFRQLTEPQVDVLWVVDDSGSMSDEQQALADNFPLFFSQTSINNVDYHIAVTTTLYSETICVPDLSNPTAPCAGAPDPKAGWYTSCPGNDRFITPMSVGPEAQFACNVMVGDTSNVFPDRPQSGTEAGLVAAKMFLSPPNITDPAINGGFLRDDAKLYVIIVSDEEDSSNGPTNLYIDYFQNLKGYRNRSLVSVSAIAGRVPGGCGDAAQAGVRYKDAVDGNENGLFHDICAADWGNQLQSLAFDSFGLKTQFFLTRNADPAQLSVCVGPQDFEVNPGAPCTPVAQTGMSATTGYWYEADSNSIIFNSGSVPDRGVYIRVEYEAACFPLAP